MQKRSPRTIWRAPFIKPNTLSADSTLSRQGELIQFAMCLGLPVQFVGEAVNPPHIKLRAVIVEEEHRYVAAMPKQAFLDQAVVASPTTGHQYPVVSALIP